MNHIIVKNLIRISKQQARRMYDEGKVIVLCPVHCNPTNDYYHLYQYVSKDMSCVIGHEDFDSLVAFFTVYNCINNQTGRYPAFYKRYEPVRR